MEDEKIELLCFEGDFLQDVLDEVNKWHNKINYNAVDIKITITGKPVRDECSTV